jgi:hypothetical protein
MKKTFILIMILSLTVQNTFCREGYYPSVKEQLEALNQNWKRMNIDHPLLKERVLLPDEVSLIRTHLLVVEETLRKKDVSTLSEEQKKNRNASLDVLHTYALNGTFPKNLYHSDRTPYFIDDFGTACAVGQLIISSGHKEFAERVRKENNNAYISELSLEYSEINEWAVAYGFTLDELAWIQPCYCSMPGPGTMDVSCYGGYDGYFMPVASGGTPPYSYNGWYWWDGSSWLMLPCGGCNLIAGYYKCTVTDAVGTVQDYFATINQPGALLPAINFTNDDGSCNGTADAMASGGTPGYTYSWAPGGQTGSSVSGLCQGTYSVTVTDNNGCSVSETVNIGLALGINNITSAKSVIFPNPVSSFVNLKINEFYQGRTTVSVYNSLGEKIASHNAGSSEMSLDMNGFNNGVYLLRIDNGEDTEDHKFFKTE